MSRIVKNFKKDDRDYELAYGWDGPFSRIAEKNVYFMQLHDESLTEEEEEAGKPYCVWSVGNYSKMIIIPHPDTPDKYVYTLEELIAIAEKHEIDPSFIGAMKNDLPFPRGAEIPIVTPGIDAFLKKLEKEIDELTANQTNPESN